MVNLFEIPDKVDELERRLAAIEQRPSELLTGDVLASNVAAAAGEPWRGAWAAGTEYGKGELVLEANVVYVSLKAANKGHKPSTSPEWWEPSFVVVPKGGEAGQFLEKTAAADGAESWQKKQLVVPERFNAAGVLADKQIIEGFFMRPGVGEIQRVAFGYYFTLAKGKVTLKWHRIRAGVDEVVFEKEIEATGLNPGTGEWNVAPNTLTQGDYYYVELSLPEAGSEGLRISLEVRHE